MKLFWDFLDNEKKIYAIAASIIFIIGFLVGIIVNFSDLPFIPTQFKMAAKVYKADVIPLENATYNATGLLSNIEPLMNNPNERLICISENANYIISLNSYEASNFQSPNLNIIKDGQQVNLENCRLLSDLEKENFNISEGWGEKLIKRL
ncbi:MAG: hypothetical protein JU82_08545 [Sulfuricurvum sp. MLSB]|uniref:hypothetical protein n=1 Tax=unclassified Sulfuricurvum TaxID=2632390 RepID=UPI000503C07A|nr:MULTISPECIES: hypothetical protein [unclassified Sulfuricurvum]KFN39075.1 MAG: hypothetical protein JU82_08545 [Sulfuricurvum sp. MLSB]